MGFHVVFLSQGTTGTIFCPLLHGKSESPPVLGRGQSMEVGEKSRVWIQLLRKEETESEIEIPVVPQCIHLCGTDPKTRIWRIPKEAIWEGQ